MANSDRIHFLGNLRAFVILLVIFLHGSLTYMVNAPVWWYVVDPQSSLLFTVLVLLVDVPIMQAMFFISGYLAMPSLQKRGAAGFLKEKVVRIGIPWVAGVLLLAAPTTYLNYYSRGVPMGLFEFWGTDFWTKLYQQSVYWYLGILMLMFVLLALVYVSSLRLQSSQVLVRQPSWKLWISFGALMSVCFLVINLFYNIDDWKNFGYLFVFQPLRLPLYFGYFVLGIYARQGSWFTADGYKPGLAGWASASFISGLLYLGLRMSVPATALNSELPIKVITAILFNSFCLSSLMAALALFQTRLNGAGRVWQSLSFSSYAMYYFHPLILYPLALVFLTVQMPLIPKALTVILLGILLSWFFSSQVVRKLPILREVF